jgi:hypothetical protein
MANNYNREEERKPNKRKNIDNIQKNTSKNGQINETPKSSQLSTYSINSLDDKSSDLSDPTDPGKEEKKTTIYNLQIKRKKQSYHHLKNTSSKMQMIITARRVK